MRKVLFYGAIFLLILTLVFGLLKVAAGMARGKETTQSAMNLNACEAPAGYNPAVWKEHMSHHPDKYQDCLAEG